MKSYLSYFRLRFITNLQYRMEAIAGICTQVFFALIFIMIYLAFYESGGNVPIGFNQYYEELNRLKDISLSIASIGSESYVDAVGDGWHDNFAFEDTMRESRKIASRINKMLEDEKYLKIVDKKSTSDDIIDIGDILKIKVIYDIDDIEEYTIKLTGKYMIDNNAKIKEVSLNSPIGRSIYLKSINDNDICYYVNDKKIGIKIIKRIYEN